MDKEIPLDIVEKGLDGVWKMLKDKPFLVVKGRKFASSNRKLITIAAVTGPKIYVGMLYLTGKKPLKVIGSKTLWGKVFYKCQIGYIDKIIWTRWMTEKQILRYLSRT